MFKTTKQVICFLSLCLTLNSVSAEDLLQNPASAGSRSEKVTSAATGFPDYNQVTVSYTNGRFDDGDETDTTNGFSLKYLHGFSISSMLPAYIETGVNFNYGFYSDSAEYEYLQTKVQAKSEFQHSSLAIPVNFAFKFKLSNTIFFKPFLGLNFKLNTVTKNRIKMTDSFNAIYGSNHNSINTDWIDYFNKEDMGSDEDTWNRFQIGWHIGADFQFNKFIVGVNYGTDFIPAFKYEKYKVNTSTLNVGIGLCF